MKTVTDVEGYIEAARPEARRMLTELRRIVRAAAPRAEERISYGMPYYMYHGPLVGFAAFTRHVSLFGAVMDEDRSRLEGYDVARGTIRFPIGRPLPSALIRGLVAARARRNEARAAQAGSRRGSHRRVAQRRAGGR
jgi:uncharacterized protein YdhG (YjbR/CyaY superfamily)